MTKAEEHLFLLRAPVFGNPEQIVAVRWLEAHEGIDRFNCDECHGVGQVECECEDCGDVHYHDCEECDGAGHIDQPQRYALHDSRQLWLFPEMEPFEPRWIQ